MQGNFPKILFQVKFLWKAKKARNFVKIHVHYLAQYTAAYFFVQRGILVAPLVGRLDLMPLSFHAYINVVSQYNCFVHVVRLSVLCSPEKTKDLQSANMTLKRRRDIVHAPYSCQMKPFKPWVASKCPIQGVDYCYGGH